MKSKDNRLTFQQSTPLTLSQKSYVFRLRSYVIAGSLSFLGYNLAKEGLKKRTSGQADERTREWLLFLRYFFRYLTLRDRKTVF